MTARDSFFRGRTRLPYAAMLVALSALGACTSSGAAGETAKSSSAASSGTTTTAAPSTTTTSAAPSPTTSVDPVIAKIPAAARPETREGSVAFAQYFLRQVNVAFTQAKPEALNGLFSESCVACNEFQSGATELKRGGLRHKGVSLTTTGANSNEYTPKVRSVALLLTQNSVPVVNAAGKTVRRTKAGSGTLLATLSFKDHWVVTKLQVAK